MVADQKALFSQRLNRVCDDARVPMRGRRIMLAKLTGVSGEAARKWLSGDAIPAMDHIASLAGHFKCSAQWLLTGQDATNTDGLTLTKEEMRIIIMLRRLPPSEHDMAVRVIAAMLPNPDHQQ